MPSSNLASSEAISRGSQGGLKTISVSTSSTPSTVEAACSIWAMIMGPTGQAGVVRVKLIFTACSADCSMP